MKEYSGKNISILEGLSAIRKRPGMYIGDTGEKGLHHCVYEVVDNSTDEASAGHGKKITLTKLKNGGIRVSDEGRGIPVDIHPTEKISAATVVLTILHAGGKFDKESYAASGGLHGVGIKATNATSKYLKLTVYREGKIWEQEFEKGEPLYALKPVGETKKTGTTMEFIPDETIFDNVEYKNELLINRLKTSSFLTKGIEFIFVDETTNEKYSFLSENGIKDFIDDLIPNEDKLTDIIEIVGSDEKRGLTTDKITGKQEENGILEKLDVNVAIQYEKGFSTTLKSYVNKIFTPGGGVHEQGVLDALSSSILKKVKETKVVSKKDQEIIKKVNTEDIKEGLVMVIALTLYTDITFEGQTKEKLGGQYIRGMVREIAKKKIEQYLEENPLMTEQIVKKVIAARRARESADRARKIERKEQSEEIGRMLGKLADCKSNNPDECELYIVEGESSGGCIFGDTLIKTACGNNFSIKEISEKHKNGEEIFIYTYNNETKKIEIQKINNAWKTKTTSDLVKVFLDNGEEIICTPDHPFLLKTGEYIPAENLISGQSLMPIYSKISFSKNSRRKLDGYEIIIQPNGEESYSHYLADNYNTKYNLDVFSKNGNKYVRHHVDFNKKNNNPSNIKKMDWYEHRELHNKNANKTLNTPEAKRKIKETMATPESKEKRSKIVKELWKTEDYRNKYQKDHHKKMRQKQLAMGINNGFGDYWTKEENKKMKSIQVTKYFEDHPEKKEELRILANKQWEDESLRKWRSEKTKEQMNNPEMIKLKLSSETKTRIENTLSFLNKVGISNFTEKRGTNKKLYKLNTLIEKMSLFKEYNVSSLIELETSNLYTYNHKVLKVEKIYETLDVYDIEVPETHNFALASGVFVHNSTKQGRDRYYQAILPLKGKPINPLKAEMKKILDNDEIVSLKTAMGCGFGEDIDISKIRYKKIIIMSDADIDGSHILQLLLTVFHTLFRPVLEAGYIYRAVPPLHRVKIGQDSIFLNTDKEKKDYLEKRKEEITKSIKASKKYKETENKEDYLEKEISNGMKKYVLTRFKGLGEMNPEQLWETTMDPEKRYLIQLKPEDIYDITNEFNLEDVAEDINEEQQLEILNILKRRKKEQEEKKGEIGNLPEINIELLINLVSGAEGIAFREKFLTRNIEGVVHE